MKIKRLLGLVLGCLFSLIFLCSSVYASCPQSSDGEQMKNSNIGLILTKDNILNICSINNDSSSKSVDCSNRGILGVEPDAFSKLSEFNKIDLSCNRINRINLSKSNLHNLSVLDLGDNSIENLSDLDFDSSNSISYLYLYGNKINRVDTSSLSYLSNLRYLNLSDNDIYGINIGDFDGVMGLEELEIQNDYDYIQVGSFDDIKNLKELSINLPGTMYLGIFSGLDNLERMSIDLGNSNELSIPEGFFSGLNNLTTLTLVGSGDDMKFNNLYFGELKGLRDLVLTGMQISDIKFGSLSNLNVKNLTISKLKNVKKGMFNTFDSLEVLNIGEVNNIGNGAFDGLVNLKRLNIYAKGRIYENSFDALSNLSYLNLHIKNKNSIFKRLFLKLSSLDTVVLDIDNREEFNCNEHQNILGMFRVGYYYDSLGILKTLPINYTYEVYSVCKYSPIFILALVVLFILINIIRRKRGRFGIMFSYFTMRKFSEYLSNPKRWRHIFMKIIFIVVVFVPLVLYVIYGLIIPYNKYNKFDIYYETFDTFESRYNNEVVRKDKLLKKGEIPSYDDGFFRESYKIEIFDKYADFWCSSSWDIDKLKQLENNLKKPFGLLRAMGDETYVKILDEMKENNFKCVENFNSSDTLRVREYSGYTTIGKLTFLSVLLTVGYYILYVLGCLLAGLLLTYILMFIYYNVLLIFINWKPDDELDADKLVEEFLEVEVDEIEETEK